MQHFLLLFILFAMLQGDTKRPLGFDSIKIVYLDKKVTEQSILI